MKATEKTSLLSRVAGLRSTSNDNDIDDDDAPRLSGWCSIWRWGVISMLFVNVALMTKYGIFTKKKDGTKIFRSFAAPGMPGPYTQTQVLGFQIHTGGAPAIINSTKELNNECIRTNRYGLLAQGSDEPEFLCYVGLEDPMEDARERLQIMRDAVEHALEVANNATDVLKIFIAPEFFFRGIDGAYEFNGPNEITNCGPICTILKGLEEIIADKRLEDWFFVFGSIIAFEKLPISHHKADYLFYNVAPIYRGFDPRKSNGNNGKKYLLPKRYTSNLDFLTPQRKVNKTTTLELIDRTLPKSNDTLLNPFEIDQTKYNTDIWYQYKDEVINGGYTMIDYDWIIMDDITMSIEICFDHFRARALQTYLADLAAGNVARIPKYTAKYDLLEFVPLPSNLAQISIVSSSGMTMNPSSLALADNATLYLQDGLYDDEANIVYRDAERVEETLGGSEAIQRTAIVSATDVRYNYTIIPETTKSSIYVTSNDEWKTALNGTFTTVLYEPMIVIYPTQPIVSV